MDVRMIGSREFLPILQLFVSYWGNCLDDKEKRGKGIAEHLICLGDWLTIRFSRIAVICYRDCHRLHHKRRRRRHNYSRGGRRAGFTYSHKSHVTGASRP